MNRTIRTPIKWIPWIIMVMSSIAVQPLSIASAQLTSAPSFRVETDIYEGESVSPQSQHLLLFDSGVVYDLPIGLGTTFTVFDVPRERVVLLHKTARVKTSIATDTLVQMMAQLRAEAAEKGVGEKLGIDAKIVTGALPNSFAVSFGDSRYEATTQDVNNRMIAAEFASFTAWASRLNIARHLGSPPFARIALADYIAAEERMPRQVKLSVKRGFKTRVFRSEHLLVERLSDLDRKKISDVGGMIATYAEVDFSEFPSE